MQYLPVKHLVTSLLLAAFLTPVFSQTQSTDSLQGTFTVRKPQEAIGEVLVKPYGVRYNGEGGSAFNYRNGLSYPKEAAQKGKQGVVVVSFIMNADGTVSDVYLQQQAHPLLDEAVLNHARAMPDRLKKGVRTKYVVTVKFRLE